MFLRTGIKQGLALGGVALGVSYTVLSGATGAVCEDKQGPKNKPLHTSPPPMANPVSYIRPTTHVDAYVPGYNSDPDGLLRVGFLHRLLAKHQETTTVGKGRVSEYHTNTFPANGSIEDTFAVLPNVPTSPGSMLFGVFDGHSGGACSQFCKEHLFKFLVKEAKEQKKTGCDMLIPQAFLNADNFFLNWALGKKDRSGACANVSLVDGNEVAVANAGDCRAVLGRSITDPKTGETKWQAIDLSVDHELKHNAAERHRLQSEHPNESDVIYRYRIKGHLQPSRGLGDGTYKRIEFFQMNERYQRTHGNDWHPPYSTAEPEIKRHTLATGLYEDLTSEQVVKIVSQYTEYKPPANPSPTNPVLNAASWLVQSALTEASVDLFGKPGNQSIQKVAQRLPIGATADMAGPTTLLDQMYISRMLMSRHKRRNMHDDITCVVIFFDDDSNVKSKL